MRRFFLPPEECSAPFLRLHGDEAHHAARVLRVQAGDSVCVLDGAGQRIAASITSVSKSEIGLQVLSRESVPAPTTRISLCCAIPKGGLFDEILEQSIELGVDVVVPLVTDHGNVRLDRTQAEAKVAKWRTAAVESIKQCGCPWLPQIHPPLTIEEALHHPDRGEVALLADLRPGGREISEVIGTSIQRMGRNPTQVSVWIGPEGDFSNRELALMSGAGGVSVTLGSRILRCPTAALSAIATLAQALRLHAQSLKPEA